MVNITIGGLAPFLKQVRQIEDRMRNMTSLYTQIGRYITQRIITERFEKEQDPEGNPWKKWSEGYKQKVGGNRKILTDTGALRKVAFEAGRDGVLINTPKVPYALVHQYGDPKRNIPARPFLGVSDFERVTIRQMIRSWISLG